MLFLTWKIVSSHKDQSIMFSLHPDLRECKCGIKMIYSNSAGFELFFWGGRWRVIVWSLAALAFSSVSVNAFWKDCFK